MALFCPQCGEIHFETTADAKPTHCRKCESDLNGEPSIMPRDADGTGTHEAAEAAKPPAKTRHGLTGLAVGGAIVLAAIGALTLGIVRFVSAQAVTATVVPREKAPTTVPGPDGPVPVTKKVHRDKLSATYTVKNVRYPQYPGVRQENDTFEVYYLPGDPAGAEEMRPMLALGLGLALAVVGGFVTVRGLFRFTVARAREADFRHSMGR